MKKYLVLTFFLILSLGLLSCSTIPDEARVSISPSSFDFGTIVQSDGIVSTTFLVKNIGNESLTINRLSTSCGCTTAEIDMSNLKSGGERTMTVTFDPTVHEDQTGPIERVVYLQTSDPNWPEVEIDITATVIK